MKASGLSLAIAVLAFGGSTIYLAVQLSEERAHSEQLADATRALNASIAELERSRKGLPASSGSFGAINAAPGAMMGVTPLPANSEAQPEIFERTVVNAPFMEPHSKAFQKMMRSQLRAHTKQVYADVRTQLGLTRDEANKLIDLLTDQQAGGIGISQDVTDMAERERLTEAAMRENKAQIADLLGPEKLKSLEEYQQSIPSRMELDMVVRQLEGSDATTLSDDQRKRLLVALTEERKRIPVPVPSAVGDPKDYDKAYSDWQDDYDARVASQARTILNSDQYAVYDDYQKAQKEMRDQMPQWRIQPSGGGGVVFSTATPGTVMEATIVTTSSDTDEKPHKAP